MKGTFSFKPGTVERVRSFGSMDWSENLLVKGDNLPVLKTLVDGLSEKVKLVYIDPPYNTGNGCRLYMDSLSPEGWLSMMEPRLRLLRELLREDGFIFVHIDCNELGHLRVLMDDIFGRENFVSQITWQRAPRRTILGQGQSPLITVTEYILLYARDIRFGRLRRLKKKMPATQRIMKQYRTIVNLSGGKRLFREFTNTNNSTPVRIWEYESFSISSLPASISPREYISLFDSLYQSVSLHSEHSFIQRILRLLKPHKAYLVEYTPSRGKRRGTVVSEIFINGRKMLPLRDYAIPGRGQELYRMVDMDNLWTDDDICVTGISGEGGVNFRRGKKPEALIRRIVELSTVPEDLVLDCFLGSGTTASVAHKLRRRWIGIEKEDFIETICIPRLERVVSGRDRTGITREVNWQGGGGFVYCVHSGD